MIYRTTLPLSRCNEVLDLTTADHETFSEHFEKFSNKSSCNQLIKGGSNDQDTRFNAMFLQHAFVYVATETVGDYPYPYITEKTWKGFYSRVPLIVLGAKRSLSLLRGYGFKTFSKWWDESYDELDTFASRSNAVICILKELDRLDIHHRIKIREEMEDVLDYNQKHLRTHFTNELETLKKSI